MEGAVIIPPVYIHDSAKVNNAVIGPYVAVAENTVIEKSILSNSIIGNAATVETVSLDSSIIGDHTKVSGSADNIIIGDHSNLNLGGFGEDENS
jgi:glucose-1-phosphate thymidylyltransferase